MSRLKKILIGLGVALAIPVLGAAGWIAMNWEVVSTFPGMPSAYESKELCSCLWVEGRPEEDCRNFIAQSVVPIQGRTIDAAAKRVEVQALWTTNAAHWTDAKYGCVPE